MRGAHCQTGSPERVGLLRLNASARRARAMTNTTNFDGRRRAVCRKAGTPSLSSAATHRAPGHGAGEFDHLPETAELDPAQHTDPVVQKFMPDAVPGETA